MLKQLLSLRMEQRVQKYQQKQLASPRGLTLSKPKESTDTQRLGDMTDKRNSSEGKNCSAADGVHYCAGECSLVESQTGHAVQPSGTFQKVYHEYMDVNENDVQEAETSGCLKPEDVYCDLDADEFQTIQNRFSVETQDMTGHSDEELSDSPFELDVQINRLSLSDDRKNFPAANRCLLARRRGSTGQITAMKLKKISSPISEGHVSPQRPDTPAYVMPSERFSLPRLEGSEKRRHSIHNIPIVILDEDEFDKEEDKGNLNSLPPVPEIGKALHLSPRRDMLSPNPGMLQRRRGSLSSACSSRQKRPSLPRVLEEKPECHRRGSIQLPSGSPSLRVPRHRSKSLDGALGTQQQLQEYLARKNMIQYGFPQ